MSWLPLICGAWLVLWPMLCRRSAGSPTAPYRFVIGMMLIIASAVTVTQVSASPVPEAAAMYRRMVEQAVSDHWPASGSSARLAAQLHQESAWRPHVRSHAGAMGMAQFMPATARWMAEQFPRELGPFDPWDPAQAIRAAAIYDRWLYDRVAGATECDRWAFTLASYNGGLGWIARDQRLAAAAGADPTQWFGHVEHHTPRAAWAKRENRGYVHRILRLREPAYIAAGWPGPAVCL